jgi:hypothetical protein
MKSPIVILLIADQLCAWKVAPFTPAQRLQIQGELILKVTSQDSLLDAYSDLVERLRGDGHLHNDVHWIIDKTARSFWLSFQAKLNQDGSDVASWQCLGWEWLAQRLGFNVDQDLTKSKQIENQLLPWLVTMNNDIERQQMQDVLEREHQTEAERLAAERLRLQQANERLKAQNNALQQVDTERLLSFLPALFARVFTVLGAADLALLCGRIEPLAIPNPYPEPSEETLRVLQRQFRNLPRDLQVQIVRFVTDLPQRQKLLSRPEMRELIAELEGV